MKKGAKITVTVFIVFAAVTAVLAAVGFAIIEPRVKINGFTELDPARLENVSKTVTLLDSDGETVNDAIYDNNKIFTDIEKIPKRLTDAFIAVEDKRFYSHHGVDYLRILSAAKNNVLSGAFSEGASTISQQLIKNTHLKSDKTLSRKIQEIRIARDLERRYSKEQILEMYLNILYFGNNIYGVGTAARVMFDKPVGELTLSESALLAGIINNPSKYNPYVHPESALKRRDTVLKRMAEQKLISEEEYASAIAEELKLSAENTDSNQYINFCLSEAAKILGKDKSDLFDGGYSIQTYCRAGLQAFIQNLISENKVENADFHVVVAENKTGAYIADCGSGYMDMSNQKRQVGSVIKPILCYAPALELKNVYTITPILDVKTSFGDWRPSNFNDKYYGWTSVEESLIHSLNIPAIKLLEINGVEQSKNVAKSFGLTFDKSDTSLSLALGSMKEGLSLTALSDAYMTFANGGAYTAGSGIKAIYDKNGKCVYSTDSPIRRQAISEENAYLITKILQKCAVKGTAKQVGYAKTNAAAKTGTVGGKSGNTDAYCIAYTPKYTVAVWLGARDGFMDNKFSGGTTPAKIVRQILTYLNDKSDFDIPEGIVNAEIDANELKNNKKVMLAGDGVKDIDKISVLFSSDNMPRVYSTPQTFIEKQSILDDFDNFEIVDGFVD